MKKLLQLLFFLNVILTANAQDLTLQVTQDNGFCGFEGGLYVVAEGGEGNYVYALVSDGLTVTNSDFSASGNFDNLSTGYYNVYVRDNNGDAGYNEYMEMIEIANGQPLEFDVAVTKASCASDDGELFVEISGGVGPYSIDLYSGDFNTHFEQVTTDNSFYVFQTLEAGSYAITVQNTECDNMKEVVIDQEGNTIVASASLTQSYTCSDLGEITFSEATGGTSPYTYGINGDYSSDLVKTDLVAGAYELSVVDSNGCEQYLDAIVIEELDTISLTTTTTPASCESSENGTIEVIATGGLGSYQYQLDNADSGLLVEGYSANNIFENLSAGNYIVSVKDANNCITYEEETITNDVFVVYTDEVGYGEVVVANSGGTPPFSYSLDSGDTFQESNLFSNLIPGISYVVTVTDANGCIAMTDFYIEEAISEYDPVAIDDAYTMEANSSIILNVLDNDYDEDGDVLSVYSIEGNVLIGDNEEFDVTHGFISVDGSGVITFSPVTDYTGTIVLSYAITAPNGAQDSAEITIIVEAQEIDLQIVSVDVNPASCGGNNGSFNMIVQGGTPPYYFSVNGDEVTPVVDNDMYLFNDLASDTYNIIVYDSVGNFAEYNDLLIDATSDISVAYEVIAPLCSGQDNSEIYISASGGSGGYIHNLYNAEGDDFVSIVEGSFTGLYAGVYNLITHDTSGCSVETEIVITDPSPVVIDFIEVNSSDATGTGDILIHVYGGTEPYQYSLDNGATYQSENTFADLVSGTSYEVLVQDANGCMVYGDVSIEEAISEYDSVAIDDAYTMEANSSIILNVLDNDYDEDGDVLSIYSIEGNVLIGDNEEFDVAHGFITVDGSGVITFSPVIDYTGSIVLSYVITSPNGAQDSAEITIIVEEGEESDLVVLSVEVVSATCNGDVSSVTIAVDGGVAPYTYSLNGDEYLSVSNDTKYVLENVTSGSYNVVITDDSGNSVEYGTVTVENFDPIDAVYEVINPSCNGEANGEIYIAASGGANNFVYSLFYPSGVQTMLQADNFFTGLSVGVYTILIQDTTTACYIEESVTIENLAALAFDTIEIIPTGNEDSGNIKISVNGGTGSYIFSLNGVDYGDQNEFAGLSSGEYIVGVVDTNGCTIENLTLTVTELNIDNTVFQKVTGGLQANFTEAISYQWINVDTKERISGATNIDFTPSEYGNYQVEMQIENITVALKGMRKSAVVTNNQIILSPIIAYFSGVLSTENFTSYTFTVYPNPADEFITLPTFLINNKYFVYDLLGKEVLSGVLMGETISLNSISRGVYYLHFNGYKSLKVIKN